MKRFFPSEIDHSHRDLEFVLWKY